MSTEKPTNAAEGGKQQTQQQAAPAAKAAGPAQPKGPVKGPEGQKGGGAKAAPERPKKPAPAMQHEAYRAKEEAPMPVTPLIVLKPSPDLFDSRIWHILNDRHKALVAQENELAAKLNENRREQGLIERQLEYLMAPSPIFSQSGVPGGDAIVQALERIEKLATTLGGSVNKALEASRQAGAMEFYEKAVEALGGPEGSGDALPLPGGGPDAALAPGAEITVVPEGVAQMDGLDVEDADDFFPAEEDEGQPAEEAIEDHGWTDVYKVPRMPGPYDLPLDLVGLSQVGEITTIVCGPTLSGNIANLSCEVARQEGADVVCIYVRFKKARSNDPNGGFDMSDWYRYSAFPADMWSDLVQTAHMRQQGHQQASIGAFVRAHIKDAHERKLVTAQRLTRDGEWVNVPTAAERKAQQAGGQQRQAPAVPRAVAPPQPPVRAVAPNAPMTTVGDVLASKGQQVPAAPRPVAVPVPVPRPTPPAPRQRPTAGGEDTAGDVDIFS